MNITDFVKNMNKTFKKYDVKFVANYADVYDSVAVFIKCKEHHIVADYLYNNYFKGVIGTNIGILNNEIVITFFDFSEYSSSEIEQLIVDAIFGAKARFNLFEGKMMNKKSLQEGIDIKIVYCDDTPSEYIDDVTMNDIYDILDSSSDICKIVDVSGSKKKVVWTDEYGFERAYESKKSLKEMKIDDKKLFKIFKEKYEELSIFTKKDFEEYREYLYWFDKLIDTENEFNKLAHKFENDVKDAFSNRYCLAFMFALEDLGLLDAIKNGKIEESKKSVRKSIKESKVDYQSVLNSVLPKEYANNKNAYKYALSCVTSLYNEDEYDSDSAKVYFLNCYISDLFPSWLDDISEEEMDAIANGLYDGTFKWKDIDKSWFN